MLVGGFVPAPDGPFDPEPQVLRVQDGVVERTGGSFRVRLLYGLRLQPLPKKRPSPLHKISGWESSMRMSHVVPDFC